LATLCFCSADKTWQLAMFVFFFSTAVYQYETVSVNGGSGPPFFFSRNRHADAKSREEDMVESHVFSVRFLHARVPAHFQARACFFFLLFAPTSSVVARSPSGGANESRMSRASVVFMGSHLPVCRGLRRL